MGKALVSYSSYCDWKMYHSFIWGLSQYKDVSCKYRDSHYRNKMVLWLSYLCNINPHTWKSRLYFEMGPDCSGGSFCRVFYLVQAHRLVSFDDDKHSWKFIKQPLITDLTHWGQDKMAALFQMTCSNAFSWMKMYEFWLRFHWSLFLRVQLTVFQHWFRLWLGTGQGTSYYRNQWWLIYWCIFVSLDLNWFK